MTHSGPATFVNIGIVYDHRALIVKRPSEPVTTSSDTWYRVSAHPPRVAVERVQKARTTTPSSGCPVSASTTCAFHGPAAATGDTTATVMTKENARAHVARTAMPLSFIGAGPRHEQRFSSERPQPPQAVRVPQEADLERLHDAIVRAYHLVDGLGVAHLEQCDVGQYRIDLGEIGAERPEDDLVSRASARDDVREGLRDIAAAQRVLESGPRAP